MDYPLVNDIIVITAGTCFISKPTKKQKHSYGMLVLSQDISNFQPL